MYHREFYKFKLEKKNNTLIALLDNPPVNALCEDVFKELQEIASLANKDEEIVSVVISSANEQKFTVGADLKELVEKYGQTPEKAVLNLNLGHETFNLIERSPKPYVIAFKGTSYGGGIELACACDIRIASSDARFAMPESRVGFIPGYGGTQRLPRLIGFGPAKKLIFSGEPIDAETAFNIGLIDEVTEPGQETERAIQVSESISKGAPKSLYFAKKSINNALNLPLGEALEKEKDFFLKNISTNEWVEGLTGFIEKRPPKFKPVSQEEIE
ncbi:MAG: enoyl-CoA hydratase/isomerase family protein [Bacteroidota bacterium]